MAVLIQAAKFHFLYKMLTCSSLAYVHPFNPEAGEQLQTLTTLPNIRGLAHNKQTLTPQVGPQ